MAGSTGNHEEVPDEMRVAQFSRSEKREPARVSKTTGEYQHNAGHGHELNHRLDRNDREPAHHDVQPHRDPRVARTVQGFHDDPRDRQRPNDHEQRPPPRAAQHAERERRVRARDEQKDRTVVEEAEEAFDRFVCDRVIER